jgi:hypothetical protein
MKKAKRWAGGVVVLIGEVSDEANTLKHAVNISLITMSFLC